MDRTSLQATLNDKFKLKMAKGNKGLLSTDLGKFPWPQILCKKKISTCKRFINHGTIQLKWEKAGVNGDATGVVGHLQRGTACSAWSSRAALCLSRGGVSRGGATMIKRSGAGHGFHLVETFRRSV
uniref:Uncharacterized protein n=1 Tax=Cannabis sativa TaxID=3483 RepID=A0A803NST5_CANSA